ncbi:MAG: hypothetical protein KF724_11825 [Phycisphaeraceae bacterium]|nr:hypothetical protein [Phycisphaeraceae bacterium]
MLRFLQTLDRRWIFLAMGLAVALPILFEARFPEKPTAVAERAFNTINNLPDGSRVLLSFDFDPASEPELGPMATSLVRHCALRGYSMYFITLWPFGPQMIADKIREVLKEDFPHLVEGVDWVNLGFQAGNEAVMQQAKSDFLRTFPRDVRGISVTQIPMMSGIRTTRDFACLIAVSAGYPGGKEWVQYVVTPERGSATPLKAVVGCTGVQTPQLFPYYPGQLDGLIGAIKGAAEYETLVNDKVEKLNPGAPIPPKYQEAVRRMGPQLVAHVLMVSLIILGNVIYFTSRRRGGGA